MGNKGGVEYTHRFQNLFQLYFRQSVTCNKEQGSSKSGSPVYG